LASLHCRSKKRDHDAAIQVTPALRARPNMSFKRAAADHAHFIACTGGTVAMLLAYGVCQERIMTRPFDDAYFDHSLFLVLCNRLATIAVAATTLVWSGGPAAVRPAASLRAYACVSVTNVVATSCQYEALKYVSFGAQTLSKCLKPVPVMVWGALWLRRRYSRPDVVTAACVMAGCWLFMAGGSVARRAGGGGPAAVTTAAATSITASMAHLGGGGLLAAHLAADGLTSTLQARMFDGGPGVSVANQVLYVSLCSCGLSAAGLAVHAGGSTARPGMAAALAFCAAHPAAAAWVAALSVSATAAALLITATVRHYGPLVLSLTMTVRQLGSVLLSAATYGQPVTPREAAGLVLVFGSLFVRGASKARAESHERSQAGGGKTAGFMVLPSTVPAQPAKPVTLLPSIVPNTIPVSP
jgi:solute carrier family 35 (adenosine 3'-phospho 5'-phosphosulfate transporter), member B2